MVSKVRVFSENLKQPRDSGMIFLNEVVTHEVVEAAFAGTTLCK